MPELLLGLWNLFIFAHFDFFSLFSLLSLPYSVSAFYFIHALPMRKC